MSKKKTEHHKKQKPHRKHTKDIISPTKNIHKNSDHKDIPMEDILNVKSSQYIIGSKKSVKYRGKSSRSLSRSNSSSRHCKTRQNIT